MTTDRLAGAILAVLALAVLWESRALPFGTIRDPGAGAVPVLLALALLGCGLAVLAGGAAAPRLSTIAWGEGRHAVAILGACAFMALALERLGYRLTILVTLLVLLTVVERRRWIVGAAFAVGFSLGTHFLFNTLLRVPMPLGPFRF